MAITASLVRELREKTNVGMMDCKNALKETDGDLEAAVKLLREKGIAKAAKKADRAAKEGVVTSQLAEDGRSGVLLEINCETDFVAKNDNFQSFVSDLASAVAASDATTLDEALAAKKGEETVDEFVKTKVLEMGENLKVSNFSRLSIPEGTQGAVSSYIHMGGKVGVLTQITCEKAETLESPAFQELIKDVNLHIAFSNPNGLTRDEIDGSLIEGEREVYAVQLRNEGKPEQIIDKIVEGKIAKFYSQIVLLEQSFVKDGDHTVESYIQLKAKELGDTITLTGFSRFAIGA